MNELPQNIQVKTESVQNIADSIRSKNHSNQKYKIGEMSGAIDDMKVAIPNTMLTIEHNGVYDVSTDEKVSVEVPVPSGAIEITQNGRTDVKDYMYADVNVPEPTGTIGIGTNGIFNVKDYEFADVNTPTPSGSITITENGTHTVTNYVQAIVNVPMPKLVDKTRFVMDCNSQQVYDELSNTLSKLDYSILKDATGLFKDSVIRVNNTYQQFPVQQLPSNFKPTNCRQTFNSCFSTSLPYFDTSLCTTFTEFAKSSTLLTDIPLYDLSSCSTTGLTSMFVGTGNSFTQDSVDNILRMCMSAQAYTSKTLSSVFGYNLPSNVSTKAQDSQYYQAFLDSGWTLS